MQTHSVWRGGRLQLTAVLVTRSDAFFFLFIDVDLPDYKDYQVRIVSLPILLYILVYLSTKKDLHRLRINEQKWFADSEHSRIKRAGHESTVPHWSIACAVVAVQKPDSFVGYQLSAGRTPGTEAADSSLHIGYVTISEHNSTTISFFGHTPAFPLAPTRERLLEVFVVRCAHFCSEASEVRCVRLN